MSFINKIFNFDKKAKTERKQKKKPIKVLSLFTGIGAFEQALTNLNIKYELVAYCEIDKYASKTYSMIHNEPEEKNLGDITAVNANKLPKDIDLITYGFPCQDISVAGKMKGFSDNGENTRSGLFFEALRIIDVTKPKIAIAENVKNLTSKRFKNEFEIVLNSLEEAGYNNYYKVLNAKNYGIPQNRERVFIVSIRKEIDTGNFKFPEPIELKLRLLDMLEDEVEEKYYLNNEKTTKLIEHLINNKHLNNKKVCCDGTVNTPKVKDIANCIKARYDAGISNQKSDGTMVIEPKINQIGNIVNTGNFNNPQRGRVYDPRGISPALNTVSGGGLEPKVVIGSTQKNAYIGQVENIAPTLTTAMGTGGGHIPMLISERQDNKNE